MEYKFLSFMKKQFQTQSATIHKYIWDQFIISEFNKDQREAAEKYTNQLLEFHYINILNINNEEFVQISGYGYEMIIRNKIIFI